MGDGSQTQASASAPQNPGSNSGAMAMTALGGLLSASAQFTAGKTNRRIADDNAKIALAQSDETLQAGDYAAGKAAMRGRMLEEKERAAQGSSGTIAGAGTGGVAIADTEQGSAMDALLIKRNAAREALGYQLKAGADEIAGEQAEAAGTQGAIATLLNTGSQEFLESDENYRGYHGSGIRFG